MTYLQAIYDRKFSESRTSFCEGNKRENFYYVKMKGNLVASERRGTGIRVRVSGDSAIVTVIEIGIEEKAGQLLKDRTTNFT